MKLTKHIIGAVIDNQQRCVLCGEVLADYNGAMTEDGRKCPSWEEGELYVGLKNPTIYTRITDESDIVSNCV